MASEEEMVIENKMSGLQRHDNVFFIGARAILSARDIETFGTFNNDHPVLAKFMWLFLANCGSNGNCMHIIRIGKLVRI